MSPHEASRRYRAFKALEQMQNDDEFGPSAEPKMYRLFHESVSVVKVKEWLGWDEDECKFTNDEELHNFYKLLAPQTPEDEEEELPRALEPKIRNYQDVRNLREILGNIDAEEALFNPENSFSDALALAKAITTPNWTPRIRAASQVLQRMPTTTLKGLSIEDIGPLKDLYIRLKEALEDWKKLTGNELEL